MGIEIIRLGESHPRTDGQVKPEDLVRLKFHTYDVPNHDMSIWLMLGKKDHPLLPWWPYDPHMENDIRTLHDQWSINNAQDFFDCLFLSQLKRFAGNNFFVVFPGVIKSEGWTKLKDPEKNVFLRGQGCVYHLNGDFQQKLNVNWVPFWQPQSLVKDPPFGSFWKLFAAAQTEDVSNSISFFSLKNISNLPQVINLLIEQKENRSDQMAKFVDWFGMYTSPLAVGYSPSAVVYTQDKEVLTEFQKLQTNFNQLFEYTKKELIQSPRPQTVIRLLSRQVAL